MYKDFSPSLATVYNWDSEFKCGYTSLKDYPHTGHPKTVKTPEFILKVCDMVLDDQQLKVCEIAEALGISKEYVI